MSQTSYQLPDLPYDYNELEPIISAQMLMLHHQKHHQAYVNNLNIALDNYHEAEKKKNLSDMVSLQGIIQFNGGGHINHSFFWSCLSPISKKGGEPPKGELSKAIEQEFGSLDQLKQLFNQMTVAIQGSGWGWLAYNRSAKSLEIISTSNHGTVRGKGLLPLMVVDVWEHAYYLQYKNERNNYLTSIWDILNWREIEDRYNKIIN